MPTHQCIELFDTFGLWIRNHNFVVCLKHIFQGLREIEMSTSDVSGKNQNGRLRYFHGWPPNTISLVFVLCRRRRHKTKEKRDLRGHLALRQGLCPCTPWETSRVVLIGNGQ